MNFHARQFDPQIGRFMGVDPLAVSGGQDGFSPYAAMGNEPAGNVDPGGMQYEVSGTALRFHPPDLNGGLLPSVATFLGLPYYHDSYDYGAYFDQSCDAFEMECYVDAMEAAYKELVREENENTSAGGGGGGTIAINMSSFSTMCWYDGDGGTESTDDTYQKAKDANDGFSIFSTGFEFGIRGILYTKAGRSMGFTFGDVTLSEARMNAQLGKKVLGGTAKAFGHGAFWLAMGIDGAGAYNYYKYGPNAPNAISPFHMGVVDAAFGYIGLYGSWPRAVVSIFYLFMSPALWFTPGQTMPSAPVPTVDNANYVYPYHP